MRTTQPTAIASNVSLSLVKAHDTPPGPGTINVFLSFFIKVFSHAVLRNDVTSYALER